MSTITLQAVIDNRLTDNGITNDERTKPFMGAVSTLKERMKSSFKENGNYSSFITAENSDESFKQSIESLSRIPYYLPTGLEKSNQYSSAIQVWLGHITAIQKGTFTAILKDLTNGGTDETADFSEDDLPASERHLIVLGAAFYWSIGSMVSNGTYSKQSIVRFQRLTNWSEEDLDKAADAASTDYSELIFD